MTSNSTSVGLGRRWRDLLLWRSTFAFLVGPALQLLLYIPLALVADMEPVRHPSYLYACLCTTSIAFGLLFWGQSPACFRRRLAKAVARFFHGE